MSNIYQNIQLDRIATAIENGDAGGGTLTINLTGVGDMQPATASTAGAHGLVPAPAAGDENKVLSGGGTWIDAGGGELGDLEDVSITSPTSGESLKYDGTKWVNGNVTAELPDFIEETSGNIVTVDAAERPAKCLKVAINPVQSGSGDPSPENVRPISGWTECNVVVSPTTDAEDGTTYPITFPSEAGTVYGGTLDVTNGVLTVDRAMTIFNGSEQWTYTSSLNRVYTYIPNAKKGLLGIVLPIQSNLLRFTQGIREDYGAHINDQGNLIVFAPNDIADANTWKTWLASNNIQVVYELSTPLTYQLTPTEVQMLLGTNNIWADTGEVKELKYIPQTYNDLLEEMTGGGVDYSTSEQDTGIKWTDGKTIYQKTINFTVAGGGYINNPTGITGIETLIKHEGIGRITDYIIEETPYKDPPANDYSIAIVYFFIGGELHADYRATTEAIGATFYITVWYTKI